MKSKGFILSQKAYNLYFNSFMKINTNNNFFNSSFIYYYTFLIKLKSKEKNSQLKLYIPYFNQILQTYPKYTLKPSSMNIYSNPNLSNNRNTTNSKTYYIYTLKIIPLLLSNLSKKMNKDL